jgi:exopolysaccharide biosynthesis polyprenyl glycosylphosphotransferase
LGYKVCGILDQDGTPSHYGLKVLGSFNELEHAVKEHMIDEVILTDVYLEKSKVLEMIEISMDHNAVFKYVPDVFTLVTSNVTSGLIGSMPVMAVQSTPLEGWGRIVKRIIDITFSLLALIITLPFTIAIVLAIKLTSKGPIIYKHQRVGRDGKVFDFYKFRSMYTEKCDYKEGGSEWSKQDDEKTRITPIGRILRKTSLDEIPQFVNSLKGDMSFVGPRPEQPKFVEQFSSEIPEYFKRHRVKSGITGWAQVNGLKGDTSIKERVKYDIYYIENWSLWLDLIIILKTISLVLNEAFAGKAEYRKKNNT